MIQRKTQSPVYWSEEFSVAADDLQHISNLLVDEELPRSAEELGRAIVLYRCQKEEALIERVMSKGTPYQPKHSYEVGEHIVFPALGYVVGEVTNIRPGHNPTHDKFQVIQVTLETGKTHEFAAAFTSDHPLNQDEMVGTEEDASPSSAEALAEQYGPQVGQTLEKDLESNVNFVRLAGKWFLKDLLVDVHVGHLNLAEALLDMNKGGPLPTGELLGDLELPEEITPQLRAFSLNYALQEDNRFDEVGPAGQVLWYLQRLEPEDVQTTPPFLRCTPLDYDPSQLTSEMLALEQQLDDEWSEIETPDASSKAVTIVLTYPHLKSGTLPLSSRLRTVFPAGRTQRIRFTFIDGKTGQEIPGWVVNEGRYVYGLEEWYEKLGLPVGAYLDLARGDELGTVKIQPHNHRSRREWIRVALPIEDRIMFEMRKEQITCDYDELTIVSEQSFEAIDQVRTHVQQKKLSLEKITSEIFPELAKLSPQGTVHAATLYSAVNVLMRTPPGPLLAELVTSDIYAPVGDNYWVLHKAPSDI